MHKTIIIFLSCCIIGCQSSSDDESKGFEERQKQLFHEIDHKLVYQGCQELMRLHREGGLTRTTFYDEDPENALKELPEALRSLKATYVRVDDVMVNIIFNHGEDGEQVLRCVSNEFGEASTREQEARGLGFSTDPHGMDKLSGTESLEFLNTNYDHFQMELIPGLTYEKYSAEDAGRSQDVKQSNEQSDMMMQVMKETIRELAQKKQKLLYQTNHDDLLKACRKVIARYNDGAFSTNQISFHNDRFADDVRQIPEIIRNLDPVYVWLEKHRAIVALIGGLDHAGVHAYAANEPAKLHDDSMKLVGGLVYFDDGLREVGDKYKDYLESLEHEAIPYLDWKRKQMNLPIPKRK